MCCGDYFCSRMNGGLMDDWLFWLKVCSLKKSEYRIVGVIFRGLCIRGWRFGGEDWRRFGWGRRIGGVSWRGDDVYMVVGVVDGEGLGILGGWLLVSIRGLC